MTGARRHQQKDVSDPAEIDYAAVSGHATRTRFHGDETGGRTGAGVRAETRSALTPGRLPELVAEVDLCPVLVAFLDQVDEPEGVIRGGDRAAALGPDPDAV